MNPETPTIAFVGFLGLIFAVIVVAGVRAWVRRKLNRREGTKVAVHSRRR